MNIESKSENGKSPNSNVGMDILLERTKTVLETYSNVHRGAGFKSMVTSDLYEKAREIVLDFLQLSPSAYIVIFCSNYRAEKITGYLNTDDYRMISPAEFGLPLGVFALAVKKNALPREISFIAGGGTTKLYSKNWIIPDVKPAFYEAGTPAIINCILFAAALKMIDKTGDQILFSSNAAKLAVNEIFQDNKSETLTGQDLLEHLKNTMIGKDRMIPVTDGFRPFVNLDSSASTPAFEEAWLAFSKTLVQPVHIQHEIITEVRKICAEVLGAPQNDYELIFTSNTTESINFVAECLAEEKQTDIQPVVLITDLEHSSNDLPWRQIPGWQIDRLPVNKQGFWDFATLEKILNEHNLQKIHGLKRIQMVAVSGASNVLGSCNDLAKTAAIVHKYGAKLLVDGAQLAAHRKVSIAETGIDFFALSAHKIYAPMGSGLLIMRKGLLTIDNQTIQKMNSSGEQNPAGIAAMGKALSLLSKIGFDVIQTHELELTRKTLKGLRQIKDIKVFGITDADSPILNNKTGVIGFDIKNMPAGKVAKQLALFSGIGTRYGCHCAHILIKYLLDFTPFLEQFQRLVVMLVPPLKLQGFTRVSFGIENSDADVDLLLQTLEKIASKKLPETQLRTVKETAELVKTEINRIVDLVYA